MSLPQPELTYSTSSPVFFASLAASNDSNRSIFSRLRERISRNAKRIVDLTIVLTTPRPYSLLAWKPLRGKSAFRRRVPTEVLRAKLESRQRKRERGWSRGEGEGIEEGVRGKGEGGRGKGKILRALHITLLVNSIFKTGSEQCPYILALAMAVHLYRCMSCSFVKNFTIKRSTPILQRVTTIFTISSRFR